MLIRAHKHTSFKNGCSNGIHSLKIRPETNFQELEIDDLESLLVPYSDTQIAQTRAQLLNDCAWLSQIKKLIVKTEIALDVCRLLTNLQEFQCVLGLQIDDPNKFNQDQLPLWIKTLGKFTNETTFFYKSFNQERVVDCDPDHDDTCKCVRFYKHVQTTLRTGRVCDKLQVVFEKGFFKSVYFGSEIEENWSEQM